ncbi:hypothetical protein ECTHUN299_55410 [Escherichia coli]|uniref:hypothetical protein n=1 Tax=Escherichia coli TaxID=562 RepID=UPI001C7E455E|nr:hypothetical protein [Escherichia coli]GIZ64835.1 hypothetical protein ECTHUN299_55410 [Escherichia coli]
MALTIRLKATKGGWRHQVRQILEFTDGTTCVIVCAELGEFPYSSESVGLLIGERLCGAYLLLAAFRMLQMAKNHATLRLRTKLRSLWRRGEMSIATAGEKLF